MNDGVAAFDLGDLPLQSGDVLRGATLAYATYGTLDADASNAIVFPTAYGGTHRDNEWWIAPGRALDPARWFVVCPNLFGAGLSSSPSTLAGSQGRGAFPHVTVYDNIAAQRRLLEHLGVARIALAVGFSMGAQQAYHWACAEPERVERLAAICGSARTAEHNIVFLDGIEAALTCDPVWRGGFYETPPAAGLRAVGRVWAGWGLSQTFYREGRWRDHGAASREAFVDEWYVQSFAAADANNLLAMLRTWRSADVGAHPNFGGDTAAALAAIRARAFIMPSATDLYFPPEDSAAEVAQLANAELVVIPSVYGHAAGGGSNDRDSTFIDDQLKRLLADAP